MSRISRSKNGYEITPSIILAALAVYAFWVIICIHPSRFQGPIVILDRQEDLVPGRQLEDGHLTLTEVSSDYEAFHFLLTFSAEMSTHIHITEGNQQDSASYLD